MYFSFKTEIASIAIFWVMIPSMIATINGTFGINKYIIRDRAYDEIKIHSTWFGRKIVAKNHLSPNVNISKTFIRPIDVIYMDSQGNIKKTLSG